MEKWGIWEAKKQVAKCGPAEYANHAPLPHARPSALRSQIGQNNKEAQCPPHGY